MRGFFTGLMFALYMSSPASSGEVTIAVASNFLPVAEVIAGDFERATGHEVRISHGSTGQIFALISNGAPFDVFLAADQLRPRALLEAGLAREVQTYALGRLVLVSQNKVDEQAASLTFADVNVALADPMLAPYGLAATAAMESLRLDTDEFQPLPVANVAQAATLFATGNAEIAFISASLLPSISAPFVLPLDGRHPPISQDAAFLSRSSGDSAAEDFWAYLFSDEALPRIRAGGYDLP